MFSFLNAVAWNGVGQARSQAADRRKIVVSVLVLLLTAANTYAQHTDDYEYRFNAPDYNTVTLTRYTGSDRAVVIPGTIDDMTVTGIGAWALCLHEHDQRDDSRQRHPHRPGGVRRVLRPDRCHDSRRRHRH